MTTSQYKNSCTFAAQTSPSLLKFAVSFHRPKFKRQPLRPASPLPMCGAFFIFYTIP